MMPLGLPGQPHHTKPKKACFMLAAAILAGPKELDPLLKLFNEEQVQVTPQDRSVTGVHRGNDNPYKNAY
jgi:hypothetical protein